MNACPAAGEIVVAHDFVLTVYGVQVCSRCGEVR